MLCLTNTGFVQCNSLGSHKVCCTTVFNFALFSIFLFACFASQTPGLCSAFPSAPVVCWTLLLLAIYVLRVLPHKHRVCAVLFPRLPWFVARFCCYLLMFCVLYLIVIGFVQCFSLRRPPILHPFVFLCFMEFTFVIRALPNQLRFVQWFFPGLLRICKLIFCFALFCVLRSFPH